jgi:hypothetical protein
MTGKKVVDLRPPVERGDVLGRIALARRLVALAAAQHHQAAENIGMAIAGLSELEAELGGGKVGK